MPFRDILTLRRGECKYCVTDDTPFVFCAEPVEPGQVYCAGHCAICYRGQGADIGLLEGMMNNLEGTVRRAPGSRPDTVPVDVQMRGDE